MLGIEELAFRIWERKKEYWSAELEPLEQTVWPSCKTIERDWLFLCVEVVLSCPPPATHF